MNGHRLSLSEMNGIFRRKQQKKKASEREHTVLYLVENYVEKAVEKAKKRVEKCQTVFRVSQKARAAADATFSESTP